MNNQPASFCSYGIDATGVRGAGVGFGIHGGGGGRRWQVRGIAFQLIVEKKSQYSPLERGIDLNLIYWSLYRCCGRVRCGGMGFVICKRGWQKMVSQGQQVPIMSLTKQKKLLTSVLVN